MGSIGQENNQGDRKDRRQSGLEDAAGIVLRVVRGDHEDLPRRRIAQGVRRSLSLLKRHMKVGLHADRWLTSKGEVAPPA